MSNPNPSYTGNQNFGDNSSINVRSAPKSLNSQGRSSSRSSYASSHFSDSGSSKKGSSDSYVSNPSYLAVLERRRTAEHAELLVKQAEERTQRKLKLLQKSFDYEKQKILEDVEEAKNNRGIVNFETYGSEKPDFESKTYENELPQKHSSFNIDNTYQNSAPSLNPSVKSNRSNAETVYDIAAFDTQNKIKDNPPFSVIHESPDEFIDHLVEGEETNLGIKTSSVNLHFVLKQDYEIRNLPPIELRRFSRNPCEWPEFIEKFRTRVHLKSTFDDNLRMERLCSVLYGEAKRVIETIGNTRRFYATALKTLKRGFGNPLLISHTKLKLLFDQPQIKSADRISLRRFHQQLKINNAWLLSMGYCTPILSNDNLTKVIMRLPSFLRRNFFKATKNSNMLDGSVNLITLENWLDKKLKSLFNPLADIISNEEDKQKERKFSHKNRLTNNMKVLVDKGNDKLNTYSNNSDKSAGIKSDNTSINSTLHKLSYTTLKDSKNIHEGTTNLDKSKPSKTIKCWLCSNEHRLINCETFLSKSLPEEKAFVLKENLCFNCLSRGHVLKNCKSDFSCRIDGSSKKHHTLLHDEPRVNINVSSNISNTKVTYLQVLPIYVSNGTGSIKVNALLDSGSDSTLVTKTLADKLKLTGKDQPLTLSNAVCTSTRTMSKLVNFQISSPSHPSKILISNAWVVENLDLPPFTINSNTINKQWNHLQDIQIEIDNSEEISVFIGADYPHLYISQDVQIGNDHEPMAISTP